MTNEQFAVFLETLADALQAEVAAIYLALDEAGCALEREEERVQSGPLPSMGDEIRKGDFVILEGLKLKIQALRDQAESLWPPHAPTR